MGIDIIYNTWMGPAWLINTSKDFLSISHPSKLLTLGARVVGDQTSEHPLKNLFGTYGLTVHLWMEFWWQAGRQTGEFPPNVGNKLGHLSETTSSRRPWIRKTSSLTTWAISLAEIKHGDKVVHLRKLIHHGKGYSIATGWRGRPLKNPGQ